MQDIVRFEIPEDIALENAFCHSDAIIKQGRKAAASNANRNAR